MKKILYILICLPLIFSSCKKEDDSPNSGSTNNTSASILGTWNLIQYATTSSEGYYTNYPNGKVTTSDTSRIMTLPDPIDSIESITWEFFSDQTMEELVTEYGEPDSVIINDYTWTKNGDTLVLDSGLVLTINTLTTSELSWKMHEEDTNSYYTYYNPTTGYFDFGIGDTLFFYESHGTAEWSKSPTNNSNARVKQNNIKESPFSSRFINRRKKNKDY